VRVAQKLTRSKHRQPAHRRHRCHYSGSEVLYCCCRNRASILSSFAPSLHHQLGDLSAGFASNTRACLPCLSFADLKYLFSALLNFFFFFPPNNLASSANSFASTPLLASPHLSSILHCILACSLYPHDLLLFILSIPIHFSAWASVVAQATSKAPVHSGQYSTHSPAFFNLQHLSHAISMGQWTTRLAKHEIRFASRFMLPQFISCSCSWTFPKHSANR